MEYITESDYLYLRSKYHDADAPYNNFQRFRCYDGVYDMSTGLNADEMEKGLREYVAALTDTAHPILKAKAFAYVTSHTPIDVNEHDYYVGIHSIDRVITKVLINKWRDEMFGRMFPDIYANLSPLTRDGALTTWPDYDHSVPNYDYILPLGFTGMLAKAKEAKETYLAAHGKLTPEEDAYYESIFIELNAVLALLDRFIAYAKANPNEKTPIVLPALEQLRRGEPKTTFEVLLFIYIYFMCSEHIEGLQVRSLSNLDRMLYPYYQSDLAAGVSEEEIRTYIAYFYMQFAAIDNYWGQPVYFGGTKADGTSAINPLSYILLDVYDRLGIWNPKIQLKYSAVTPRDFLKKALDMVRRGHNSIVFVCEETMRAVLESKGVSAEEARLCNVTGCYEYGQREGIGSLGAYINLAKFVEYTLNNGIDMKTGRSLGISLGEPESFATFEDFTKAYLGYVSYAYRECAKQVNRYEAYYDYVNPMPLFSSTRVHSLEIAKDAYSAGAVSFGTGYQLGATANMADSLAMIKKYVYDRKEITFAELKAALKADFVGYEALHSKLLHDSDKYGNNRDLPDGIAKYITEAIADSIIGNPDGRGGTDGVGMHVARQYIDWKDRTASTPDGRIRGTELAKNASPSQGAAVSGAAAAMLSMTKLDGIKFGGDFPLDICMHPGSIAGEEGLNAMLTLLDVYRQRHGHAVHFNVLDTETLRKAQEKPEDYRDLQIRVCGWNALFNSMNREEQEGFIRAAEGASNA